LTSNYRGEARKDYAFFSRQTPNPFSSSSFPLALFVHDPRHGDCVCAGVAVGRVTIRCNAYGTLGLLTVSTSTHMIVLNRKSENGCIDVRDRIVSR